MMRNEIADRRLDRQTAVTGMVMMLSAGGGGGQRKGNMVQQGLKKGPWTAAEDSILMEYVKKHGEGNWNSVQKNCGLLRCGKSCRLRHLRPNLKKGAFTPEEERVIIELHAKYGNKWARMATQLPGRTDNEIKNYWSTRMKRRQRAGLSVYRTEFQDQAAAFHHMQHHEQNNLTDHHTNNNKSSSLFSVFRKAPDYTPCFSLSADGLTDFSSPPVDCFKGHSSNNTHLSSSAFYGNHTTPNHHQYFNTPNGTVLAPLSLSPLVSTFALQSAAPPVTGGGENMASSVMSFTSLIMGDYDDDRDATGQLESFSFASASELPSLQTPPRSVSSNAAGGGGGGGVCVVAEGSDNANSNNNNKNDGARVAKGNDEDTLTVEGGVMGGNMVIENNSWLLDALLVESKAICGKRKADEIMEIGVISSTAAEEEEGNVDAAIVKRSCTEASFWGASNGERQASCDGGGEPRDNMVFSHSSNVMEPAAKEEETAAVVAEEMSSMDDDLLSLLANFPSSIPLPEWYSDHSTIHNPPNVNSTATATAVDTAAPGGDGGHASPAI